MATNKATLVGELERIVQSDVEARQRAHREAAEAATHEEARPENDKDTRALEQSYLAGGEARRVEEAMQGLADIRALGTRASSGENPVALGALVTLVEGDQTLVLLVAPYGGGARLDGGRVQVVTPRSPLGRAVLGHRVGDECEVPASGRMRELYIQAVE
jgi:transcription elongation GreA/GreB family factor